MKINGKRIILTIAFAIIGGFIIYDISRPISFPEFETNKMDWRRLRLGKDDNIKIDGSSLPVSVRVLCIDTAHVYIIYQGRFYALNGMATELGNFRLHSEYGNVPVSVEPPYEIRRNTSDLIQVCDNWFEP